MKKFFRILFDTAWAPIVLWIGAVAFSSLFIGASDAAPGCTWLGILADFSFLLLLAATLVVAVAFVRALLQRCWRRALVLALFAALVILLFAVA